MHFYKYPHDNVPLIQQGIDQLFGKGRLQLEIPEEGKAALVPLHRLNRDEKALVHVLEPYIVWAADNEQMVEALSDERMQLESNDMFTNNISREINARI